MIFEAGKDNWFIWDENKTGSSPAGEACRDWHFESPKYCIKKMQI